MMMRVTSTASQIRKHPSQSGTVRKMLVASAFVAMAGLLATGPARATSTADQPPAVAPAAAAAAPQAPTTCSRTATVWWSELLAPETERLTDFYAKVMGWNTKIVDAEDQSEPARTPDDRYTIFTDGVREVAGLMKANHPEAAHTALGWFTYMQVPDVEAAVAKAVQAGGKLLREPTESSEGHIIAVISDPMGNAFGLVTPANNNRC
jgi:predicted enzyme related to lactoylglutathione lyase